MNRVIMTGNLTKDPELRYTQNNKAVCTFGIAVNQRVAKGAEPKADFFTIVAWEGRGEFAGKYFRKGQKVLVEGRLSNRNWDDDKGVKHYATEIIADELEFADGKREDAGPRETKNDDPQMPASHQEELEDLPF